MLRFSVRSPQWLRLMLPLGIAVSILLAVPLLIVPALGIGLTEWGWLNLVVIDMIVTWYVLDTVIVRRSIYQFFGFLEPPLNSLLRFWRRVILLGCGIATAGSLLTLVAEPTQAYGSTIGALALLLGPALAAFGWMYTTYEKEKSDRAAKTLSAIQEQVYGAQTRALTTELAAFRRYLESLGGYKMTDPVPLDRMHVKLKELPEANRPDGPEDRVLGDAIDQFLNVLDLLSFGVRQGELDFQAVQLILRQRLIKAAYLFTERIWSDTNAKFVETIKPQGRYRSTQPTWEHFLWLVANLDALPSDAVNPHDIVMPPRYAPVRA